ncbi:DUF4384 domain-containing protein [uncultured Paludibaculum sp.]|uniref:DUF4384 domain-containing protein n=1 Tax=uncultured Paludibaculum sp. TaxID=1765020 RepID=UPI002AAB7314|nr:DUF4384 domain-containing protein [uncultured Paludibaculum sp.]
MQAGRNDRWCWVAVLLSGWLACLGQSGNRARDARDLFLDESGPKAGRVGARYSILLSSQEGIEPQPVDPSTTFKTGDCIAVELETNFSGYVNVMGKGVSGHWEMLVPSASDPAGVNVVRPRVRFRLPREDCIEFTDPPGVEYLVLSFSQDVRDPRQVFDVFRLSSLADTTDRGGPKTATKTDPVALAQVLGSRDLKRKQVGAATQAGERPFSVYVEAQQSKFYFQISLKHQ